MSGGSSSEDDFDLSLSESVSENNASDEDYCPSNFSDESEDIPDENSRNSPSSKLKNGKGKSKKRHSMDSGKGYDSMGSSASEGSFHASSSNSDDDLEVKKKKKKPGTKKIKKMKSKTGKSVSSR